MRAVTCTSIVCIRGSDKCMRACIAQPGQTCWNDQSTQPGQTPGARENGQAGIEKGRKSQTGLYHMGARAMGKVQRQQITASSMRTASLHCPPRPVTRDLLQNGAKWQVVEGLQPPEQRRENPVIFRTSKSFSDNKGTPPTSPSISSKSFSDKKGTPPSTVTFSPRGQAVQLVQKSPRPSGN